MEVRNSGCGCEATILKWRDASLGQKLAAGLLLNAQSFGLSQRVFANRRERVREWGIRDREWRK